MGYRKARYQRGPFGSPANVAILLHMDYEYLWNFFQPTIVEIDATLVGVGYNLVIIAIEFTMAPERVMDRIRAVSPGAVFLLPPLCRQGTLHGSRTLWRARCHPPQLRLPGSFLLSGLRPSAGSLRGHGVACAAGTQRNRLR